MKGFARAHGLCVALVGFLIGADAGAESLMYYHDGRRDGISGDLDMNLWLVNARPLPTPSVAKSVWHQIPTTGFVQVLVSIGRVLAAGQQTGSAARCSQRAQKRTRTWPTLPRLSEVPVKYATTRNVKMGSTGKESVAGIQKAA